MDCDNPTEFKCYFHEHREAFDRLLQMVPTLAPAPHVVQPPAQPVRTDPPPPESLVHNPTIDDLLRAKGEYLITIAPTASLNTAAQMMHQNRIGLLLVREESEAVVGVLSERDYARKVILAGRSSRETRVEEIMTTRVVTARPEQTVEECMALMTNKRIRHLPVMQDRHLLGMISIGDLVKEIIAEQQFIIAQLENYIST